jgi:hypothetical protein
LGVQAEDRYPFYLPEWVWRDNPNMAAVLDPGSGEIFEGEAARAAAKLENHDDTGWADLSAAVRNLHSQLSVRDLVRFGDVVTDEKTGRSVALWLDPTFSSDMKAVLREAVAQWLSVAISAQVVDAALADSSADAGPIPTLGGPAFQLYARSLLKPRDAGQFIDRMSAILMPAGSIPVLVISSSSGDSADVWWGGGTYDSYRAADFQLTRTDPGGFLYIRLNPNRMLASEPRNDARFWASKIAHEILHNVGYWHPSYANPAERDKLATPGKRPFIYAYELAVLAALDRSNN